MYLILQVLLADKLDGDLRWPMIAVVSPLLLALFTLILLSFGAKGGNKCNLITFIIVTFITKMLFVFYIGWFGIRKNFSQFLLLALPFLQEYGNISYHADQQARSVSNRRPGVGSYDSSRGNEAFASHINEISTKYETSKKHNGSKLDHLKPIVPIISIDLPD